MQKKAEDDIRLRQYILLFTPLIILVSIAPFLFPEDIATSYVYVIQLIGLGAVWLLAMWAHTTYANPEFRFISNCYMVFAFLFIAGNLLWLGLASYNIQSSNLLYLSHILWLTGYLPLIYSCGHTMLSYSEYAVMRKLVLTMFFAFTIALALLGSVLLAITTSEYHYTRGTKFITILYIYLDCLLLFLLLLLLQLYRAGVLASYWLSVTAGILLFTSGDLFNAVVMAYNISTLWLLPSSLFSMSYFYLSLGFGLVGAIHKKRISLEPSGHYSIEQIFLLYKSGSLIYHKGKSGKEVDKDILGGMLTAVQNFVKDSFLRMTEKRDELKRLQYGKLEIHTEQGMYVILAVVIEGKGTEKLHEIMASAIQRIESRYKTLLEHWDGDRSGFQDIDDYLEELML
ncbi:MAG: hypothetical protein AB1779_02980 [Candidatus Thermoplasmatota archaeon]